jgi:hypothetical protein
MTSVDHSGEKDFCKALRTVAAVLISSHREVVVERKSGRPHRSHWRPERYSVVVLKNHVFERRPRASILSTLTDFPSSSSEANLALCYRRPSGVQ